LQDKNGPVERILTYSHFRDAVSRKRFRIEWHVNKIMNDALDRKLKMSWTISSRSYSELSLEIQSFPPYLKHL
jgi:hypothetical protein